MDGAAAGAAVAGWPPICGPLAPGRARSPGGTPWVSTLSERFKFSTVLYLSGQPGPHFQGNALRRLGAGGSVHLPVDGRYLIHKAVTVAVFQVENIRHRPVE